MDEWMDEWRNECMKKWMHEEMNAWMKSFNRKVYKFGCLQNISELTEMVLIK